MTRSSRSRYDIVDDSELTDTTVPFAAWAASIVSPLDLDWPGYESPGQLAILRLSECCRNLTDLLRLTTSVIVSPDSVANSSCENQINRLLWTLSTGGGRRS